MFYKVRITGLEPGLIMHNGAAGIDTTSATRQEMGAITRKKGSNRTEADNARLRELECQDVSTMTWTERQRSRQR